MAVKILQHTALGTVIREDWNEDHIKLVRNYERKLQRPICGAKTQKGLPCKWRPEEKYGGYCKWHKDGQKGRSFSHGHTSDSLSTPNITTLMMTKQQLREHFHRCNVCVSRATCQAFNKNSHCIVEEELFERFIVEIQDNYDFTITDKMMLFNAGMSFIRSMRANRSMARLDPIEAEEFRLDWMAVRNSKEFRDTLKELGVSRRERIEQMKEDSNLGNVPTDLSLSQIMSHFRKQMPDAIQVQITKEFKIIKNDADKRAKDISYYEEIDDSDEEEDVITSDE